MDYYNLSDAPLKGARKFPVYTTFGLDKLPTLNRIASLKSLVKYGGSEPAEISRLASKRTRQFTGSGDHVIRTGRTDRRPAVLDSGPSTKGLYKSVIFLLR